MLGVCATDMLPSAHGILAGHVSVNTTLKVAVVSAAVDSTRTIHGLLQTCQEPMSAKVGLVPHPTESSCIPYFFPPSPACQCNNHSDTCVFEAKLFSASGDRSGGQCLDCRDNTTGEHCQRCLDGYRPSSPFTHPEACSSKCSQMLTNCLRSL